MSRANELEQQMLELINEERTSRGLTPVELELRLNDSSEDHSQWMLNEDQFSHTGANGSSAGDRMRDADFEFDGNWTWGENIAYQSERGAPGLADDVEDLHTSLMNSPGHRANILNPDYEVVGLGIETGDFEGVDAVMVTQNFASTDAEVQLDEQDGASPDAETPAPETDPETVAEAPDAGEETPEPTSEPEPEAETPDPETPQEPVAQAPEETEEPETGEPQPEPVAEAPDPDEDAEMPEPVAEAPTEEPETPVEDPDTDPEIPDVVDADPEADNDVSPFAQLQFFASGFLAVLLEEDFTFTFEGGDDGEPQTVSFDLDAFFGGLLEAPEGDDSMEPEDDMVMAAQDAADTAFQFTDHWDCLA